jgi:phenylalanyl-tRNA synthetase alpha chain
MGEHNIHLHTIEKRLLEALAYMDRISIEKLAETSNLTIDQVRRGVEWLKFKNLVSSVDKSSSVISLASQGFQAAKKGLPERRLVKRK